MSSLPQLNVLTYNNQITWLFFTIIFQDAVECEYIFPKILNLYIVIYTLQKIVFLFEINYIILIHTNPI